MKNPTVGGPLDISICAKCTYLFIQVQCYHGNIQGGSGTLNMIKIGKISFFQLALPEWGRSVHIQNKAERTHVGNTWGTFHSGPTHLDQANALDRVFKSNVPMARFKFVTTRIGSLGIVFGSFISHAHWALSLGPNFPYKHALN